MPMLDRFRRTRVTFPWLRALERRPRSQRTLLGISAGLAIVWLALAVRPEPSPAPRWTEADLPSVPAESDNAWSLITANDVDIDIPAELAALADASDDDDEALFWTQAQAQAPALREFLATGAARERLVRVEQASARAQVVDTCTPGRRCTTIAWRETHQLAVLAAIDQALADRPADACASLHALIRMDVAHLASARSLISWLIGLANLADVLDRADRLALRLDGRSVSIETRAALAELAATVGELDVGAIDLRVPVVQEYVAWVALLDAYAAGAPELGERLDLPRVVGRSYDRGVVMRDLDDRFEARYQAAVAGDVFAALGGEESSPGDRLGPWLRDPIATLVLDRMLASRELAGSIAQDTDVGLAAITASRSRLLARPAVVAAAK